MADNLTATGTYYLDPGTGYSYPLYVDPATGETYLQATNAAGTEFAYLPAAPTTDAAGVTSYTVPIAGPDGEPGGAVQTNPGAIITPFGPAPGQEMGTPPPGSPMAPAPEEAAPAAAGDASGGGGYDPGYSGGGGGYSRSYGRSYGGGYGGGYAYGGGGGSSYNSGSGSGDFPFRGGFGADNTPPPRYADGTLHPFFGGPPRVPGGAFNDGQSSGGGMLRNDGGGPIGPPGSFMGGGSSGGGGGFASAMRSRLLGGLSGGGSYPSDNAYDRSQRLQARDTRQYEREQERLSSLYGMMGNDDWAYPLATGRASTGAGFDFWSDVPVGGLTMLTQGTQNANRWERKPQSYKRDLTSMYRDLADGAAFSQQQLLGNLFGAGKNSSIARSFMTQAPGEPNYSKDGLYRGYKEGKWEWAAPTTQVEQATNLLGAAYRYTMAPEQAATAMDYATGLMNDWASRQMGRDNYGSLLDFLQRRVY